MNLLFPSLCFECQTPVDKGRIACDVCSCSFDFLNKRDRRVGRSDTIAACFFHEESVVHFVELLRRPELIQLHKTAAAFLAIQLAHLNWPLPEVITSVPSRFPWQRNVSEFLARALAKRLKRPYKLLACRNFGAEPQEKIPQFFLKRGCTERYILIVDDFFERGETLKRLSHLLESELPTEVFGLAVSKKKKARRRSHDPRFAHPHRQRASSP